MPSLTRTHAGIAVGVPVAIGLVGLTHPAHLTYDDALHWRNLHVALLLLFPLLALAPWLVTRSLTRPYAWVAAALGFVYACFYTALDVLAGIGAGGLKHDHRNGLATVFGLASDLGQVGSIALIGATALACGCALRSVGARAVPGTVLVLLGSYGFMERHIYWPGGVLSMFAIATGWAAIAMPLRRDQSPRP
jgi:hypothetical protein